MNSSPLTNTLIKARELDMQLANQTIEYSEDYVLNNLKATPVQEIPEYRQVNSPDATTFILSVD